MEVEILAKRRSVSMTLALLEKQPGYSSEKRRELLRAQVVLVRASRVSAAKGSWQPRLNFPLSFAQS